MHKTCFKLLVLIWIGICQFYLSYGQVNFPFNSQFKYLKGSEAENLNNDWMSIDYDDSSWSDGEAPFRYGDGEGGTVLDDMHNNYSTVYLRAFFNASDINKISQVYFNIDYDDGFIIWINNQEVIRRNAPDILAHNSYATNIHESGIPEMIMLDSSDIIFNEGINTIAIQGFNISLVSSDFYFDIEISALPSLSDSSIVSFSNYSGFYYSPFNLTLTSTDTYANIVYTLDGSDPQSSQSSLNGNQEITLYIDPNSTSYRPATPAFIVRASLTKEGFSITRSTTKTYIFIENIKNQQHPGGGWPSYNINNQVIDLKMDQDVINSSQYADSIDDALLDIPSISIATNLEHLFDPSTGIYVNAYGHGHEWERPCSFELINPDGSTGFQVNAGLRIRGGWSRHPGFPKHAFRLFFRNQYGESKLYYPLFEDEGVTEFDKIDLRTSQNYAWANRDGEHNTMVRDVFSRESQGAMNQPYTRSRYYHLYLNGLYWGLFQTQERSEARYASDYFGGDTEDYDVIKVNTEDYVYKIEATDGFLDTWQEIWTMCYRGFTSNEKYFILEGKDKYGNPMAGFEVFVDIDNLIDYMITIFYTGNFDSPTSSFFSNKGPNNFYAIFNHDDKSKGFVFFIHDAEHAMMIDPIGPGIGIYENRVEPANMYVNDFNRFHPQWLHHKLTKNAEYRLRFADRAYKHLMGNGVLTSDEGKKRFNERVEDLKIAIIAESARWGDTRSEAAHTKNNAWLPELEDIRNAFFPYRTNIVIGQLKNANLFPELQPPLIIKSNTELEQGEYQLNDETNLVFENHNLGGEIFYTLNGNDPRKIGGSISNDAIKIQSGESVNIISSAVINTRIYDGETWSHLKHYSFYSENDDYSNLKMTELHYHPQDSVNEPDTISGKSYEFIEFLNIGETALNLSGFTLDSAVFYEFPNGTILPQKSFYVIATKPKYFYEAYGMVASGNCDGFFSNAGEYILLNDSTGNEVLSFTYDDQYPWTELADGDGYSLTSNEKYPINDPNDFNYWMHSSTKGGSPFAHDKLFIEDEPILTITNDFVNAFPNPTNKKLFLESELANEERINIVVYNSYGMLVYKTLFHIGLEIDFQSMNLSPGMYIFYFESDDYRCSKKIIYTP